MIDYNKITELCDHAQNLDTMYDAILETAKKTDEDAIFIEIGTRAGGTALLALNAIFDSGITHQFITVDPYGNKPFKTSDALMYDVYGDGFYRTAMSELSNFCLNSKLDHIHFKMESIDFMNIFQKIKLWKKGNVLQQLFGYVYLDGEHHEEIINTELNWFLPKVVNNGLIIIDDIEHIANSKIPLIKTILSKSNVIGNRAFYYKNEHE